MTRRNVSVIIPAYRAASTIGRAVDSVLAQTVQPWEILVIDDGSPDDLETALTPYFDRLTMIRKDNGGAASARNMGLDYATGDFVAFLDADDYWAPTMLAQRMEIFGSHPEVALVATRYEEREPDQLRGLAKPLPKPFTDSALRATGELIFQMAAWTMTSTVMIRTNAMEGMRFDPTLTSAEDRDLWIRLIKQHAVYLIGETLATVVLESGSLSRSNVDIDCANMLRVVHRYPSLLGPRGTRQWEIRTFRRWAAGHLGTRRPHCAIRPAWCRLVRDIASPEAWWILLKSAALSITPTGFASRSRINS